MRDKRLIAYARENRKKLTDAERLIWRHLRYQQMGTRFRRQHPIGRYIADFAAPSIGLVVELDGSQHRGSSYDRRRDSYLRGQGWKVIRFWDWDVMGNTEGVLAGIADAIEELS